MVRPYVCATCRNRISAAIKPTIRRPNHRTISHNISGKEGNIDLDRLQSAAQNDAAAAAAARSSQYERNQPNLQDGREDAMFGRYSRKELKPEEILSQLDRPWHPRPAPSHSPQPNHPPQPQTGHPNRSQYNETGIPIRSRPHGLAATKLQNFMDQVRREEYAPAWQTLGEMCEASDGRILEEIQTLVKTKPLTLAMTDFNWNCTRLWLKSMQYPQSTSQLPKPTQIFLRLRSMHAANSSFWRPVLWQMSSVIFSQRHSDAGLTPQKLTEAVHELVGVWYLCLESHLVPQAHGVRQDILPNGQPHDVSLAIPMNWDFLPSPSSLTSKKDDDEPNVTFESLLLKMVPFPPPSLTRKLDPRRTDYVSPALVTFDLLRTTSAPGETASLAEAKNLAPFALLLNDLLKMTPQPRVTELIRQRIRSLTNTHLLQQYQELAQRVGWDLDMAEIRDQSSTDTTVSLKSEFISDEFTRNSGESSKTHASRTSQKEKNRKEIISSSDETPNSQANAFTVLNIKRLSRALEKSEIHAVDGIHREIMQYAAAHTSPAEVLPLELYEHLMLTFLMLKQPRKAIDVWNHMLSAGYEPTVKTYTAMMRGAHTCRDVEGMEAFWSRMRQSGLQPDETAWGTRIFGLIKLRRVRLGLLALQEMSNEWFNAARQHHPEPGKKRLDNQYILAKYPGSIAGHPRPSVTIMNSAISALALTSDTKIPEVIAWGRSLDIEPNITTYNTLLNITMRHGQADEAEKLLTKMREKNIPTDSTTWTVLLTAMFQGGFLQDLSPAEQTDQVLHLITSLSDAAGGPSHRINDKGYALVIDRLLKLHQNPAAASAVLQHMVQSGRQPTSHIYTILMASYFQQRPLPDFAAIEALWSHISAQDSGYGAPLDNIFFDRMIEGYAAHHHLVGLQPALSFLKRMEMQGKRPSWTTLGVMARALVDRGEKAKLKGLVSDVRDKLDSGKGVVHVDPRGQRAFWDYILSTGLLRDEGIMDVEELMSSSRRRASLETADVVVPQPVAAVDVAEKEEGLLRGGVEG